MQTQKVHTFQMARNIDRGLTLDQIRAAAPSAFAEAAHFSRSARYTQIPTVRPIEALMKAGFVPVQAQQSGTKLEGHEGFTKHMIQFCPENKLGRATPETIYIGLTNSHNGSSAYDLYTIIHVLVCSNGLIRAEQRHRLKVHHKGDIVEQVLAATLRLATLSGEVMENVNAMKALTLDQDDRLLLAEFAIRARFGLDDFESDESDEFKQARALVPFQPQDFLRPKYRAETETNLFATYNTVQRHSTQGGASRYAADGKGKRVKRVVRSINSIDGSIKVNTLLDQFAQKLLETRGGYSPSQPTVVDSFVTTSR